MKDTMTIGMNRTGVATAPRLAKELFQVEAMTVPSARGDESELAKVRADFASEDNVGSVPPPLTPKGLAKTVMQAMRGEKGAALVDKLGERLAFERQGTRLYEGIMAKHAIYGSWPGGPTHGELVTIRDEEKLHFELLVRALRELGGDPTAMTPSADVSAVIGRGIP